MSATETKVATNEQPPPPPPKTTLVFCIVLIPLISAFLDSIDKVLASNNHTRQLYTKAKVFLSKAIKLTEPLQARLEPLITRADSMVESDTETFAPIIYQIQSSTKIITALTLKHGITLSWATTGGRQPHPPTVNPSLSLPARHESPPLDDILIPPGLQPKSQPEYVSVTALENPNVKVPKHDIISNTPEIVKRFIKAMVGVRQDFEDVSPFVIECMMWAVNSQGPTSPGSPTPSNISQLAALTIVSQKSDDTVQVGAPHAVSAQERAWYYNGVTDDGDQPELLYRTSLEREPWVASTSRYAHPPIKFARPVHGTLLNKMWNTVGPLVDDLVCATVKRCYSIDPVRFFTVPHGEDVKNGTLGSAVIWVTVHPDSNISVDTAHEVSQSILQLLTENGVNDVQVEWCEGITSKLAGPPLLPVIGRRNATAHVRRHLTAALGMPIAPAEMEKEDCQGSVGFFFHENVEKNGNLSNKVLAITNHHVLCKVDDKMYDFRAQSSPRQQVRVCGTRRFQQGLDEIKAAVFCYGTDASACAEEISELEVKVASGGGNEDDIHILDKARGELEGHRGAIMTLEELYKEINASWGDITRRNIGILEYSPPISVNHNDKGYTEDWATIRLDSAKFKPNFVGNAIDLGTAISPSALTMLLYPRNDSETVFKYPSNRLLRIRGVVTKEKLANPDTLDSEGQPCLVVMKDGCRTGLTLGRSAGLESYLCNETGARSIELAIYNYDKQSGPFSAKGDSGSLIVNAEGEMVGLLHSGGAKTDKAATYVTYATPAWRLLEWIKAVYPNADFAREIW